MISISQGSKYLIAIGLIAQLTGCRDAPQTQADASTSTVATQPTIDDSSNQSPPVTAAQSKNPPLPADVTANGHAGQGTDNASNRSLPTAGVQNGDSKTAAQVNQTTQPNPPVHVREVLQRIDMRKFPFMDGNSRTWPGTKSYGFSGAVSASFNVENVMNYLDKLLLDAGCVRGTDPSLEFRIETGAAKIYWHGDLMITASCGTSRGTNGPDINAGIIIDGNVDLRSLPIPPNTTLAVSKPNSLRLMSSIEILDQRKFYSGALRELGWIEYRDYLPGVSISVEDQLPHQRFLKNGVFISFYYRQSSDSEPSQGKYEASVSTGILEYEPTLPSDARSVKLRQSSPIVMVFETELSPHDVRAFYDKAYLSQGFRGDSNPTGKDDQELAAAYSHANQPSLKFEGKRVGKTTLVVVNEIQ
jgi:hypothetical protein